MKKLLVSLLFVSTTVMAQEATDEQLPVVCGSLQDILSAAKTEYNETPVATWLDPRLGRFFLLSNLEGDSVTQILAVEGIENAGCVISVGSELLLRPHKEPTF
jgi:hypothetical protein